VCAPTAPTAIFLDILFSFYNENKNSLSWKKGSAESELNPFIFVSPSLFFTPNHISLSLSYFIIFFSTIFNLITLLRIIIINNNNNRVKYGKKRKNGEVGGGYLNG